MKAARDENEKSPQDLPADLSNGTFSRLLTFNL